MFKYISKTLLTGLATVLPIILTLYLLYWFAVSTETFMKSAFGYILSDSLYFPGLGIVVGLLVIFLIGLLMKAYAVQTLFRFGEKILYKLPLVNSIYRSFRDFFNFFTSNQENLGRAVAVKINGVELVGFITQEESKKLPPSFRDDDYQLIYLPMSYMIGGYTVLVAKKDIRVLDMSKEEAMKFVLTAGITGKEEV
jgi:uncharacterized membrane protein